MSLRRRIIGIVVILFRIWNLAGIFYEVVNKKARAVFDFDKDIDDVNADQPDAKKLHAAENELKKDDRGKTGLSRSCDVIIEGLYSQKKATGQSKKAHQHDEENRLGAETGESQKCVPKLLDYGPSAFSRGAGRYFKGDGGPLKADPMSQAPEIGLPFTKPVQLVHDAAVQKYKIRGILNIRSRQDPKQRIIGFHQDLLENPLVVTFHPDPMNNGKVLFFPQGDEPRNQFRRMLKIGVHNENCVSPRQLESGHYRRFLAEIPAELEPPYQTGLHGLFLNRLPGFRFGAVVDQKQFVAPLRVFHHPPDSFHEFHHGFRGLQHGRENGYKGRRWVVLTLEGLVFVID